MVVRRSFTRRRKPDTTGVLTQRRGDAEKTAYYTGIVRLPPPQGNAALRLDSPQPWRRRLGGPQEIVTRSFYMKREPMDNEREPDSWLGTTLRQTPATASD